jgi:hypothetical protein
VVPFLNPAYKMSFSVKAYFFTARFCFSELFYLPPHTLVGRHMVLLFALLFIIADATRHRPLWFLAWFAVLAPLPVLFIPPCSFFVMYLPLTGWAMVAATGSGVGPRPTVQEFPLDSTRGSFPLPSACQRLYMVLPIRSFGRGPRKWTPMSRFIELSKQDFMRLTEPLPQGASPLLMGLAFQPR